MFEAAVARTRNDLFLACANRDERFDGFARLCLFRAEKDPSWAYFDLPVTIADATLFVPDPSPGSLSTPVSYVFLEEDGDIYHLPVGREPETERIAGSGLWQEDSEGWGYLTRIRQIGSALYSCGTGGQVYKRLVDGSWEHIDAGLLRAKGDKHGLSLEAIAGPNEQEIYVGGWHTNVNDGVLLCWDGHRWTPAAHDIRSISSIHVERDGSIWACGRNGTLLHGNRRDGFAHVLEPDRTRHYVSVVSFDNQIFLATETGLFVFEGGAARRLKTGLTPEYDDGHLLQVVDGVLWAIGSEDIARFDGTSWERISFPGNSPIG
jgi:hypothetical protein